MHHARRVYRRVNAIVVLHLDIVAGRQQVVHILIVHLHEGDVHRVLRLLIFAADFEQLLDCAPIHTGIVLSTHHGVRFATTRLTIGEETNVVPVYAGRDDR